MEIEPWDALWWVGCVFMTLVALFNLLTAGMNFFWKCQGNSLFGWEMDAVYGILFFTYPRIPFSICEGLCALLMAVGCFMAWGEDPLIQMVAFLLQEVGCAYWIICIFYAGIIKDLQLACMAVVLVVISLGCAFTRGPGYIFRENEDLELPFWICSGVILGKALIVSIVAVFTMNEMKWKLVDRMWAIKEFCKENKDYTWPVENAQTPEGAPDGFDASSTTENTGMKSEAGRTEDAAVTQEAGATEDAAASEETAAATEKDAKAV